MRRFRIVLDNGLELWNNSKGEITIRDIDGHEITFERDPAAITQLTDSLLTIHNGTGKDMDVANRIAAKAAPHKEA